MASRNSYSYKLDPVQQAALEQILQQGNYKPAEVPHTRIAVKGPDCSINLYKSGKCLVQGKGALEWVQFVLEPEILGEARAGYEEMLEPEASDPHMGIDESGKGDFFGPLVVSAAYINPALGKKFAKLEVQDSKRITSDAKAVKTARALRDILGNRFSLVRIQNPAYNRMYAKSRNVNRMLAWGHARAIEDLLEVVPSCPRALSDQFGPTARIEQALMEKGRKIIMEQRPRAESDPAVAAASIFARATFVTALQRLEKKYGSPFPKGASARVIEAGVALVKKYGPGILLEVAKCHFQTTDKILEQAGHSREELGPEGQIKSRPVKRS